MQLNVQVVIMALNMVISSCCSLFLFLLLFLFVCLFFCRGLHGILSPKWSAARAVQLFVLARQIKFLVIVVVVARSGCGCLRTLFSYLPHHCTYVKMRDTLLIISSWRFPRDLLMRITIFKQRFTN